MLPSIVYALFTHNGDLETAGDYMDAIVAQLDNVSTFAEDFSTLPPQWAGKEYGDWVSPATEANGTSGQGPKPTSGFTSAFSAVRMAQQAAEMATALGRADAETLAAQAQDWLEKFNEAWLYNDTVGEATYDQDLQTNLALALALGAAPEKLRGGVRQRLLSNLESTNYHLTTGILGVRNIFDVLFDMEEDSFVLAVLEQVD